MNELKAGDIVEFLYLHLDTVKPTGKHARIPNTVVCTVEGKSRPMLVLTKQGKRERNQSWYLVLKITTKGLNEQGAVRDGYMRIGNCLERGVESFVELLPQRFPHNLVTPKHGAPCRCPVEPFAFQHLLRIVQHNKLRWGG